MADVSTRNNAVVHFEMPCDDASRVADFYKKAFGWDMQVMGQEWGGYVLAMTGPSTQDGPTSTGYINGGFYDPKQSGGGRFTTVVVQVANLDEAMKKVTEAGGKLLLDKPMEIPQVGLYMAIEDSEGNRVGVLQPAS